MENINDLLKKLGLNEKERNVYLSLLPIGRAPASILGNRTGFPRTTTRYTCQQLVKKGVFYEQTSKNTVIFGIESPEKLLYVLERQEKEIQEKKEALHSNMRELKAVLDPYTELPKVKFYEGKKGITDLYEEILSLKKPIDSFEDKGEMVELISNYIPKFIQKRKEYKIKNRVICPGTGKINKNDKFRVVKNTNEKEFPFSCDIKICGDRVGIFSFNARNPVGISIHHQEISDNFRILFDYFWNHLKIN